MAKEQFTLSVHGLVDFLLRSGDIDNRIYNDETMRVGSKIHSEYQNEQDSVRYISEYFLSGSFEVDDAIFNLSGRADGIILDGDKVIIDEIKSTVQPLIEFFKQQNKWHLGQAECYALMYANAKNIDSIGIRLTYISQTNSERMIKDYTYSRQDLMTAVLGYCKEYLDFYKLQKAKLEIRDKSIKDVTFPFKEYRNGQQELIDFVKEAISNSETVMASAPTGIGKTMSTLYPSIKSLKRNKVDKIFYLTSKGTGRDAVFDAMSMIYDNKFIGKDSYIVAKDKICFCPDKECNPDQCPFAKGYYDKIKSLMIEGIESDKRFDIDYVTNMARKNLVCPHELQLDLSLFADVIVCDINYFFDPVVKLQRYFGAEADPSKFVVLLDEAHNLVDRGRAIFSQKLTKKDAEFALMSIEHTNYKALKKSMAKLIEFFSKLEDECSAKYTNFDNIHNEFITILEGLKRNHQAVSKKHFAGFPSGYLNFYLDARRLIVLANDFYNENYQFFACKENDNFEINLFCLDASAFLTTEFERVRSTIMFSATLSPMEYYKKAVLLSGECKSLVLQSPFPRENMNLMVAPKVSVRYKDRENTYAEVACYLKRFVESKLGNYFIYFPSYEYMYSITPYLDFEDSEILMQNKDMNDDEKATFLSNFRSNPICTTVGLLVLGGAFSEGIDLINDRLIGVAVIGVGFPQVNHVNELIKNYHDKVSGHGFSFAYIDPGMNKVTQAVGRLIRSETDKGSVLLLDDRYLRKEYRDLFADTWDDYDVVLNANEVSKKLSLFYKK